MNVARAGAHAGAAASSRQCLFFSCPFIRLHVLREFSRCVHRSRASRCVGLSGCLLCSCFACLFARLPACLFCFVCLFCLLCFALLACFACLAVLARSWSIFGVAVLTCLTRAVRVCSQFALPDQYLVRLSIHLRVRLEDSSAQTAILTTWMTKGYLPSLPLVAALCSTFFRSRPPIEMRIALFRANFRITT